MGKTPTIYSEYSDKEPNAKRALYKVRSEVLKARFLELYAQTASVMETCRIIGMVPRTVYHWKQKDPKFKEDFDEADAVALQTLEDEATRRAAFGTQKPVYQGGKLAGYVTEYSDTLMITLLKARAPHKYKERFSGELTGADGKPLMPDTKIIHIHSDIPLSESEEQVSAQLAAPPTHKPIGEEIEFVDVTKKQEDLDNLNELSNGI